jgi:hypothetical protein
VQTTLRFDETLMRRAKAEAARKGMSLTRYIEEALRERLRGGSGPAANKRKIKLSTSRARGGLARDIRDLKQAREVIENGDAARLVA